MRGEAGGAETPGAPGARGRAALYLLLGFAAGMPFFMGSTVLALRLAAHGVGLVLIGFFAWVTLLPTFKFVWAPLLDAWDVPGFAHCWGRRRGWIMLAQLGIFASLVAMALTAADASLAVTALCAVLLAFWTTTLEIAADGWRIELAPSAEEQGPIVAAYLWGYRGAMVLAGSGALIVADHAGWTSAYLVMAAAAGVPFVVLAGMPGAGRGRALAVGVAASAAILAVFAVAVAGVGWGALWLAIAAGLGAESDVTRGVLLLCLVPFAALLLALPRIRRARAGDPILTTRAIAAYAELFWRFGYGTLPLLAFVSLYRMGDVLANVLAKPLVRSIGYSLTQIGVADGVVALAGTIAGVSLGGWLVTRWRLGWALAAGALLAAIGNWGFVALAHAPLGAAALYAATFADQFGNGFAASVFVVYLSMLVNPAWPGAQYAFLSGFAFLLPRLIAGASGGIARGIGYDGFFLVSGALSAAAILLVPVVVALRGRDALPRSGTAV